MCVYKLVNWMNRKMTCTYAEINIKQVNYVPHIVFCSHKLQTVSLSTLSIASPPPLLLSLFLLFLLLPLFFQAPF